MDVRAFSRHLLETMPSGLIAIGRDGRVVLVNVAAARILDLGPPEALLGRPCREVLAACPDVARLLLDNLDAATARSRAELDLRRQENEGRTLGYTLSPVRDAAGAPVGAAMFFKDLTRIERLEEQARLKDRLAALGEMAAGLAHEMRNPVAAIEIHAALLRRSADPSLAAHMESLDHILNEVHRLNETITTCLDFVRPVEVVERVVAVEPLLDAAVAAPGPAIGRVEREYAPEGAVTFGDAVQLRQAFDNLVRNAREAAGPGGTVRVRTRVATSVAEDGAEGGEEPQVVVEVADDGPGIPPDYRDRIFHPFFTTKPRGSGLGLALVQRIVQSHRGRIDFSSETGRGTIFRIVLRAAPREGRP